MPYTPTSGRYAVCKSSTTTIPAKDWSSEIDGKEADASNFRDGRAVEATLEDVTTQLTVCWDQADQPTKAAGLNLRIGTQVTLRLYVDGSPGAAATKYFEIPSKVMKISPKSVVQGGIVEMPVTFRQNGAIVYPSDA